MSLSEKIFQLGRKQGAEACQRFLDAHPPGKDREERETLASWRSFLLSQAGKYAQALDILNAATPDFVCKSAFALKTARLFVKMGKIDQAIAILRAAPTAQEVLTFPGLAWEAAYFCCYLTKLRGVAPPRDLLDLIPQDFETMIDDRILDKHDLLNRKL